MSRRSPVLFVALDACDPPTARQLAAAGRLPTLARLFERAASCTVRSPVGLFVGALWVSFFTGRQADRHGYHCWDEIDVKTYKRQLTPPPGDQAPFWQQLSDAGRSVAVIDVPHVRARRPLNGVQVAEWGNHDRHYGFHTWPPKRAAEIDAAIGLHPILGTDAYSQRAFAPDDYVHRAGALRNMDEEIALIEGMLRGAQGKRRINKALRAEQDWDLFLTVFGESHCTGHQQWHLHDPSHPRFRPDAVQAVGGDPILRLYSALDEALGESLAQVGQDTTVLVLLSHGMAPHFDGGHLLDHVLHRLDLSGRTPSRGEVFTRAARSLAGTMRRRFVALAVPAVRRRFNGVDTCPEFVQPFDRARQRYFMEPNNSVMGGVRLNLAQREPCGVVQQDEVDEVCRELRDDLLALVNVDTGGPVVRDVWRSDRWYRRSPHDTMPDLFVDWERSAPIENVWSPKIGHVHAPYTNWRTGDHRPDGVLLAFGPGIPTGTAFPAIDIVDLAPTIAERLGVTLDDVDGRPAAWLTGHA